MEQEYEVTGGGPVLAIFAHPDDAEFVAGGALARWAAVGRRLIFAFCTDGGKGSSDPTVETAALIHMRQEEQRAAARAIGCHELVFLPYEDAMLEPTVALRRDLTRIIRRYTPQIVVAFDPTVFWIGEYYLQHPDHRASGAAALAAIYPCARDRLTFPELLAEGLEPHHVEEIYLASPLEANRWIDISSVLERKIDALLKHTSQFNDPDRIRGMMRTMAKLAGEGRGLDAAEAYRYINLSLRGWPGSDEASEPDA